MGGVKYNLYARGIANDLVQIGHDVSARDVDWARRHMADEYLFALRTVNAPERLMLEPSHGRSRGRWWPHGLYPLD